MSNAVFPALPGLKFDSLKTPIWKSFVQESTSGMEVRGSYASVPAWRWTLAFEFLRQKDAFTEYATLVGFFNARAGKYDSFLYDDPTDDTIADVTPYEVIGTGDGTTTAFQLQRTLGGFAEPVYNTFGSPKIYLNNVLQASGYSILGGTLTFTAAPGLGVAVAWSGNYYWRCRFEEDTYDFQYFAYKYWSAQQITFRSIKGS